jgi:hypothetical protein
MKTIRPRSIGRTTHGARSGLAGLALAGALLALGGCEAPEGEPMDDMPMEEATDRPMAGMEMDPEMMQRHAEEAEAMGRQLRDHVDTFRSLPPDAQGERMTDF